MQTIDVMSVRIWLDKKIPTRSPANVFAKFEELRLGLELGLESV
jgi:hypothetical protein